MDGKETPRVNAGYHFVSFLTLFIILIVETHYSQPLFESSLDFIIQVQAGASSAASTIWSLYSNVGIASGVALPPSILLLIYWDRLHSFFYVIMLTAMLAMMNVTKLWYHQPRPFWVDEEIQAFDCTTQFGNPSGHSLFSMGAALTLWLDFNERFAKKEDSRF